MEEMGTVARAAVAVVFAVAAVAKLARPAAASGAFGVLRVPAAHRVAAARALGLAELGVAGLLLTAGSTAALLPAAAMLVAFSGFLARLEYGGKRAGCGCLGDLGSQSHVLGLIRNACLLGLVALAAGAGSGAPEPGAVVAGLQVAALLFVVPEGLSVIRRLRIQREVF